MHFYSLNIYVGMYVYMYSILKLGWPARGSPHTPMTLNLEYLHSLYKDFIYLL